MTDTLEAWLSSPYPSTEPDAPAFLAVLEALLDDVDPPRADVSRVQDGRLLLRGKGYSGYGEHSSFHVWYCCARLGRTVPVRECPGNSGTPTLYDAPWQSFSCLANAPWNPNGPSDGWRAAFDAAYASLT